MFQYIKCFCSLLLVEPYEKLVVSEVIKLAFQPPIICYTCTIVVSAIDFFVIRQRLILLSKLNYSSWKNMVKKNL
jgi:hypothetical protein